MLFTCSWMGNAVWARDRRGHMIFVKLFERLLRIDFDSILVSYICFIHLFHTSMERLHVFACLFLFGAHQRVHQQTLCGQGIMASQLNSLTFLFKCFHIFRLLGCGSRCQRRLQSMGHGPFNKRRNAFQENVPSRYQLVQLSAGTRCLKILTGLVDLLSFLWR